MNNKDKKYLSTIVTIETGFLVVFFIWNVKWALWVSLIIGITGIISPYLSRKVEYIWKILSDILGLFVPNILLTIVFYLILFPVSVLYKLFNKDPLMLSKERDSYFIDTEIKISKEYFEKIW